MSNRSWLMSSPNSPVINRLADALDHAAAYAAAIEDNAIEHGDYLTPDQRIAFINHLTQITTTITRATNNLPG